VADRSRHLEELTYFNAIACLLVVFIHVLSTPINLLRPDSWQLAAVYLPWRMAAFVVPAFLFSGAVKMAQTLDDPLTLKGYLRYMGRRIRKIYLPYLLWNLIYYLAFARIDYVKGTAADLLHYILTGTLSSPFYYVLVTMQFYALLPFWHWLVKRIPWYLGLLLAFPLTYWSTTLNQTLGRWGMHFAYTDRIFSSYLLFWVMGLYAGRHYRTFSQQLKWNGYPWAISLGTIFLFGLVTYLEKYQNIFLIDLHLWKFFVDCICILTLLTLSRQLISAPLPLKKALSFVSEASFFVYLSHCFFLTFGTMDLEKLGIRDISALTLGRMVLGYAVPLFLYYPVKKWKKH